MPDSTSTKQEKPASPRATYRLQLHEKFNLKQARNLVPYLHDLGISHIYASPIFKARPHSTHGYDTCDFSQLNPELGTEKELGDLVGALRERGMGLVIDIAPNHMGIGVPENNWWWDVLAQGPGSPFAKYFDIDWNSPDPRLRGKVLAPILGDRYPAVLANRQLRVENGNGKYVLRYGESVFPINAQSWQSVQGTPDALNANPEALDALLEKQYYRLAYYGEGDAELNYRRFCNISDLAGICTENEQVFNQVFALTRQWLERGWLDGLRVDHLDGLKYPTEFLERLKRVAPRAWIVVEKILQTDESMPTTWPIAGTTGYDFLVQVDGLFIDGAAEKDLTEVYVENGGTAAPFAEVALEKKRLVLRTLFAAEVDHLTNVLERVAASAQGRSGYSRADLTAALVECLACFPVYRTYAQPGDGKISDRDARYIKSAISRALETGEKIPPDLIQLIGELMELKHGGEAAGEFVVRFQQLCAACTAKGVEDTAFYNYNRFVALNEVGGEPGKFGTSVDDFHAYCKRLQTEWPDTMLASSTHDTKRSEDVRARLFLLSEIPGEWRAAVERWSAINKTHRRKAGPDHNAEYLFYQTVVGAWPLSTPRATEYMNKAIHEAKDRTSWSQRNEAYDAAVLSFVSDVLADSEFIDDVKKFVRPLIKAGCVNALAMTLIKLTAPGIPDTYQGTELWDFSLVDPDNRRPVAYETRQELMRQAETMSGHHAWTEWEGGLPKLWLIRTVLKLRAEHPEYFAPSAVYRGVAAEGPASAHAVIFQRGEELIAVTPRLVLGLKEKWGETNLALPPGTWRNVLSEQSGLSGRVKISKLLAEFPVALLVRENKV
jgi:(1->4)-alpha-D-glucan 1-alpha-D-glucosylmutase